MKELKCPKCGSVFSVDEADYALIMNQVKNAEFKAEIDRIGSYLSYKVLTAAWKNCTSRNKPSRPPPKNV